VLYIYIYKQKTVELETTTTKANYNPQPEKQQIKQQQKVPNFTILGSKTLFFFLLMIDERKGCPWKRERGEE
jgi:hypothetical protein